MITTPELTEIVDVAIDRLLDLPADQVASEVAKERKKLMVMEVDGVVVEVSPYELAKIWNSSKYDPGKYGLASTAADFMG